MDALGTARRLADVLDEDQLPYAIGGALALGVWGAPRATKDVDITIFTRTDELPRVLDSVERAGIMIDRAAAARGVAQLGLCKGRLGRIIVDIFISEHPQYADMFQRRRKITDAAGGSLWFISAEDLALHKLIFGRDKDVTDLETLLAVRTELDLAYVRSWLVQMVPEGDRRIGLLDDLERRFPRR